MLTAAEYGSSLGFPASTTNRDHRQRSLGKAPPVADAHPAVAPLPSAASAVADGLVGLPPSRAGGLFRFPEDTFPKGPIGEVMKARH